MGRSRGGNQTRRTSQFTDRGNAKCVNDYFTHKEHIFNSAKRTFIIAKRFVRSMYV